MSDLLLFTSTDFVAIGVLILRLFIGICFVIHGLGKLGLVGTGNMQGFEQWLKSLNVPFPALQARMAMLAEVLGGFLMTTGLMTRPACALLFFTMVVAGLIGHKGGGYLITNNPPGNEYTINLAAILVAIALFGPGPISLDSLLFSQ